ncbi:hypothetical protein [Microbacterium sp. NIBRBAC000506063]|uniref:hypothetical protein n=1 Tax=Microbacterium sp. NIBRBAC000506063 TaxID=2734618 RepID=UPI001BB770DF|nr:hypothetical protein [Microbacterium sp. NIBRBAC000506063]QTV79481.1 hypothetical protein KAE78_11295 [Microbacterium sp. NIBRBAC000506063]
MSLKRYTIPSGRRGEHTITVKLTEAEAKRLGATPAAAKAAKPAANTKRTPRNKAAKPAAKTAPKADASVEAASDPDASE